MSFKDGLAEAGRAFQAQAERNRARKQGTDLPISVKTYKNEKEFEQDAKIMVAAGYKLQDSGAQKGKVNLGRTGGKLVGGNLILPGAGVFWAVARPSRKGARFTVTWVREDAQG